MRDGPDGLGSDLDATWSASDGYPHDTVPHESDSSSADIAAEAPDAGIPEDTEVPDTGGSADTMAPADDAQESDAPDIAQNQDVGDAYTGGLEDTLDDTGPESPPDVGDDTENGNDIDLADIGSADDTGSANDTDLAGSEDEDSSTADTDAPDSVAPDPVDPPPSGECDSNGPVFQGDFLAFDAGTLNDLQGIARITGDLHVTADVVGVVLPNLECVFGDLIVETNSGVQDIALEGLHFVGGLMAVVGDEDDLVECYATDDADVILVRHNPTLESLSVPNLPPRLRYLAQHNPTLWTLAMSYPPTEISEFVVEYTPLETLDLSTLEVVGHLSLQQVPVASLDLSSLTAQNNDGACIHPLRGIRISGCENLEGLDLPQLSGEANLEVTDNPSFGSLSAPLVSSGTIKVDSATEVLCPQFSSGTVELEGQSLATIDFSALTTIIDRLLVQHTSLTTLSLPNVVGSAIDTAGGNGMYDKVFINHNAQLTSIDLGGFTGADNFEVTHNASLSDVTWSTPLFSGCAPKAKFSYNPQWSQCDIDALISGYNWVKPGSKCEYSCLFGSCPSLPSMVGNLPCP